MGDNVLTKVKKTLKIKRKSGGAEMLIRFNVKNFLSFSEREDGKSEEFSMIAGKVRNKKAHVYDNEKIKLLKLIIELLYLLMGLLVFQSLL